jgi:hypothetical protein
METVQGATDVLEIFAKGFVDVVIWVLIVLGPFLLVAALIVGLVFRWRRQRVRPATTEEPTEPAES